MVNVHAVNVSVVGVSVVDVSAGDVVGVNGAVVGQLVAHDVGVQVSMLVVGRAIELGAGQQVLD